MYSRARTTQPECRPVFSVTVSSRLGGRIMLDNQPLRELSRKNQYGDTYRQNKVGQVTHFKYRYNDRSYSFGYDAVGTVATINSSDGWSWTRMQEPQFDGWLVRNYFDSWRVDSDDCEAVNVTEEGVHVLGNDASQMALPVRP